MRSLFLLPLIGFFFTSFSHADPASINKIWSPANLDQLKEGDRIGLIFKNISIQLEIDTRLRTFLVHTPSPEFNYNPGDKLVDLQKNSDEFILNESWKIIAIDGDNLLLANEVIQGQTKRHIIFQIPRHQLDGFYKSQHPDGVPFLYSYFIELA